MNTRKAKNIISKLELEDGTIVGKEDDIVSVVTDLY